MNSQKLTKWLTEEQQKWELLLTAISDDRIELRGVNRRLTWHMRDQFSHPTCW